jgi:L-alanine-DL-glutamate epimerase-like enolase superfamily enzyme
MPLAGPELQSSLDLMRDFLVHGATHFLQFDVVLAGGISAGRDLAGLARAFHRPVTLHCAASAVGLAASAHLGAAIGHCDSLEYHLMHQGLHERLWPAGWTLANGEITVPDKPGLGLDFDLDTLLGEEAPA